MGEQPKGSSSTTSFSIGDGSTCDRHAADSLYRQIAVAATGPPALRVMCLYPASYPLERQRLEQLGQTFAGRCDGATFFVAPAPELEPRPLWHLKVEHGGHRV